MLLAVIGILIAATYFDRTPPLFELRTRVQQLSDSLHASLIESEYFRQQLTAFRVELDMLGSLLEDALADHADPPEDADGG
jgi:hypothetical protein